MNMIFNASAGTGKTYQVTELYCALVLGTDSEHLPPDRKPVAPEKILLMTFTDNAAAELRRRVSEKMIAAQDENDLARQVLRKLPAANISTIHAFCAGLLREHALELGLSPVFQTLEDEERDALLDETLKAELFRWLETDADFRAFCAGVSVLGDHEYSVISTIKMLLEKAASRGLDLSAAEAMLPSTEQTVGRADFERIRDELADAGCTQKTALDALDALNIFLEQFPEGADGLKKFGRIKQVKHLSDELFELQDLFLTERLYAEHVETFRAFARCLARCASVLDEAKRARDCVDFGDQLLFARDLLKEKTFENPSFEWIIVDEVQDTSRVQCDVIEALWSPKTSLVICGDKKQSIYAWRSADPNVMPDLEKAMVARGEYNQIPLAVSYRSNDRVIHAVNQLFDGIYASYDALEPREILDGEGPCVEFLQADDEEQGSDEEMAAVARRIQLLVNGGDGWRPKYGHDGQQVVEGQSFGYGDILILLKRSTHQNALEKALREVGIPYTSGGKGKALFEQQEVRDLLLFLQTVTQPKNDLALVGFLRSPFANLPDDEIIQLGWDGKTFDHEILRRQFFGVVGHASRMRERVSAHKLSEYRDAQRGFRDESNDQREWQPCPTSVFVAAERLLRYRALAGEKLPSQLLRDIVRETAFDAYLAGQPGGEQKLANFKKALDWIRDAERGGQVLTGDVVRRFERAIKTPPKSGAAEALLPDPEQDSVTIMTVHGAKGLTKRVCFVPDISFADQADKGFAVFGQETLELKISGLGGNEIKSPGWTAAREADKTVRHAESLNVFYVAMTRARDLVVLSGAGTQRAGGWLKLAKGFIEAASPDVLRTLTFSDLPRAEEVRGVRPEALGGRDNVVFRPLEIPKGVERKPVTSLVEHQKSKAQSLTPPTDRRSVGTLGHLVLEELAKSRWQGDVAELLSRFSAVEYEGLAEQLEDARTVLAEETAGAEALFTEHPFVLKRENEILDGTIDLLAQLSRGWKILDYKFSNEPPDAVLETYAPQLAAYKEAIEKLHPGAEVRAGLVLITDTVQTLFI